MDTGSLIIIELAVVLGAVVAFGVWELRKLRRLKERRMKEEADASQGSKEPDS